MDTNFKAVPEALDSHSLIFAWHGALIAFFFYNANMGLEILKKAFLSLYENRISEPGNDAKAEGYGHLLNYLIQLICWTRVGGYLAGLDEIRPGNLESNLKPGGSTYVLNWGIISAGAVIVIWNRIFGDLPWLRRQCIWLMHQHTTFVVMRR
jgi:hypothetical protein